jgi:tellurium resistance protein TerZ
MGISLAKGEAISLEKKAPGLSKVAMGLGWDVAKGGFLGLGGGGDIDLDASAILFDAAGRSLDMVWFRDLKTKADPVYHSGDNRTGAGDGDDETIYIDLSRLPAAVVSIVLTVNSFQGQTFGKVKNAYVRLVDLGSGAEVAKFDLATKGSRDTGFVMAVLSRKSGSWDLKAIGEAAAGRTVVDLAAAAARHL